MTTASQARYTKNLEAAQSKLGAAKLVGSFPSLAAQKDATENVGRAHEELRSGPMQAPYFATEFNDRTAAMDQASWAAYTDLHNWRAKHTDAILVVWPQLAEECAKVAELLALRAAIKALPIVKPDTKRAATERAVAAIKEAVAKGVASPIALAIAPLRDEAVAAAKVWAEKTAEAAREKLTAAGFDLEVAAPYPKAGIGRERFKQALALRAHLSRFMQSDDDRFTRFSWSVDGAARFVQRQMEETAASFDSFVLKLDGKVGAHTAAELVIGATWCYSILRVTMADGTVQRWKTQSIVNCSVLGKLFNQWPTRLMKCAERFGR